MRWPKRHVSPRQDALLLRTITVAIERRLNSRDILACFLLGLPYPGLSRIPLSFIQSYLKVPCGFERRFSNSKVDGSPTWQIDTPVKVYDSASSISTTCIKHNLEFNSIHPTSAQPNPNNTHEPSPCRQPSSPHPGTRCKFPSPNFPSLSVGSLLREVRTRDGRPWQCISLGGVMNAVWADACLRAFGSVFFDITLGG